MRLPDLDGSRVRAAVDLAEEIYRLHEAGRPYAFELSQLSEATNQQLELADADGAFGSVAAADWAHDLLALSAGIPEDLTRAHLVEMVEAAQATVLPEWQLNWVIRCVEHVTHCADFISIFDSSHRMSSAEMVDAAYAAQRRVLVTPPPEQ